MYAVERDIPITGLGSTTCQHEKLKHGIEPDECYYITTPLPPMGIGPLDLTIHAPPDLAVEVDVTSSSIPRQPIYGALGVPEVWRFDGTRVVPLHRQVDGTYRPAERSLAFPDLPMTEFNRFLAMALTTGPNSQHAQHAAVVALRDWARR
jgi:Uma2 family endonuclease